MSSDTAPPFPTLATTRLLLREIGPPDALALYEIHGNAEAMKWFGADPVPDLAAAMRLVEVFASWRLQSNPGTRWGLQWHGQPTLIGSCGLFGWNRNWRKCTLGYELAPAAQGRGLMFEALCTVLDWGFEHMQLHRVEALIHPDNAPSLRLVQRLGFVEEGRLREVARWGGRQHDMLQVALLRTEWRHRPTEAPE